MNLMFWSAFGMCAVHLWWLSAFLGNIFGTPVLGGLALALFAVEGAFYAAMAWIVARLSREPLARVWLLAGGWVVLESLRFLGPFAFPWPTLGYALLATPTIQIADLGGVLLGSVLITATAAALVSFRLNRSPVLWVVAACWVAALVYGLTRTAGTGPSMSALVLRSQINVFDKVTASLGPAQQFQIYNRLSQPVPGTTQVVIWPETAIQEATLLASTPGPGVYGMFGGNGEHSNRAVGWDGQRLTGQTDKARPVPFGEYFPLKSALAPVWHVIEQGLGFTLPPNLEPARDLHPIPLGGVNYGAYVCYDSVFPWVARKLTGRGANVLVNISNDGWYAGWGVQQHFMMGRVRAIENRRWVLRSVNEGIAGSIDDLGHPVRTLDRGEGRVEVGFKALTGQTVYNRLGDLPALLLAGLMIVGGLGLSRRP